MTDEARHLAIPLSIVAIGVATALPGPTSDALAAIRDETRAFRRHPTFMGPDGSRQLCAPSLHCLEIRDAVERTLSLYEVACREAGAALDAAEATIAVLPWWLNKSSPFRFALDRAIEDGRLGPQPVEVITGDAAAGAAAFHLAADRLKRGGIRTIAVVAADTAIAPAVLDMNEVTGFAHTRQTRHIPVPGEAAVALVLSATDDQFHKLRAMICKPEPIRPSAANRPLMGLVSAGLLASLTAPDAPFDLIADLDGERHRSEEFGVVSAMLARPRLLFTPPISVGYVGTATLALQIAIAASSPSSDMAPTLCWTLARSGMRIAGKVTCL